MSYAGSVHSLSEAFASVRASAGQRVSVLLGVLFCCAWAFLFLAVDVVISCGAVITVSVLESVFHKDFFVHVNRIKNFLGRLKL